MSETSSSTTTRGSGSGGGLDRYFKISERGSTVEREIRGGVATFFTMAYIVVLNPIILSSAPAEDTPSFLAIASTTALLAGILTILMGVVGKYPFALAAGLGINAVVAFQLAPQIGYGGAMGVVLLEGLLILVLVLTGVRETIFNAIPMALKQAIGVGIGLFLAFIGFVDGGFIRGAEGVPPVSIGNGGALVSWPQLVFAIGLLLTAILMARKVRGAIVISVIVTTIIAMIVEAVANLGPAGGPEGNPKGWALVVPSFEGKDVVTGPDFSAVGAFDITNVWEAGVVLGILFIFTLMLADFFDTMGTVVAVGGEAGALTSDGKLPGLRNVLVVDSIAAAAGGAGGVSSNTTYIESASGVGEGARTGLASVVTGALFLVAIFLTPLTQVVPSEAAAPVLVVVGFLLMAQIKDIPWDDWDIAVPAFLGFILMPFTFSITNGIGAAFIAYAVMKLVRGRARDVHPLLWVTAVLFVIYFAIEPLKVLFGIN